jgi:hypothetical protein
LLLALVLLAAGCSSRRVVITSEPAGATVVANDVELGRTPLWADFRYHGVYDVLVTKDGFEPLRTSARARAPIHQHPPIDLLASPLSPDTTIRWHFVLEPALESTTDRAAMEASLLERAHSLRQTIAR